MTRRPRTYRLWLRELGARWQGLEELRFVAVFPSGKPLPRSKPKIRRVRFVIVDRRHPISSPTAARFRFDESRHRIRARRLLSECGLTRERIEKAKRKLAPARSDQR